MSCQACTYGLVSSAEVPLADTSLVHGQDQSLHNGVDVGDGIHWGYQYAVSHRFIPLYFGSLTSDLKYTSVFLVLDISEFSQSKSVVSA